MSSTLYTYFPYDKFPFMKQQPKNPKNGQGYSYTSCFSGMPVYAVYLDGEWHDYEYLSKELKAIINDPEIANCGWSLR